MGPAVASPLTEARSRRGRSYPDGSGGKVATICPHRLELQGPQSQGLRLDRRNRDHSCPDRSEGDASTDAPAAGSGRIRSQQRFGLQCACRSCQLYAQVGDPFAPAGQSGTCRSGPSGPRPAIRGARTVAGSRPGHDRGRRNRRGQVCRCAPDPRRRVRVGQRHLQRSCPAGPEGPDHPRHGDRDIPGHPRRGTSAGDAGSRGRSREHRRCVSFRWIGRWRQRLCRNRRTGCPPSGPDRSLRCRPGRRVRKAARGCPGRRRCR